MFRVVRGLWWFSHADQSAGNGSCYVVGRVSNVLVGRRSEEKRKAGTSSAHSMPWSAGPCPRHSFILPRQSASTPTYRPAAPACSWLPERGSNSRLAVVTAMSVTNRRMLYPFAAKAVVRFECICGP